MSPAAWVCWLATTLGIGVFVRRIRTAPNPLIPPQYFHRRNFVLPMVLRCSANFAYFAAFFLAPLVMKLGYSFSLTKVGLVSIARPLCFAVFSPIAGYAAARVGERTTAVVGTSSLCASLVIFALMGPTTPLLFLVVYCLDQPPHVEKLVQFVNAGVNRVDLVLDPALAVLRVFVPFLDQVDCPVKAPHRQLNA